MTSQLYWGHLFYTIYYLSKLDQNKILDLTLDLKSKRRGKGQKIIQQRSSKRKHKESKVELTQRIQKQLKDFAKHNPENKNDRPSYWVDRFLIYPVYGR